MVILIILSLLILISSLSSAHNITAILESASTNNQYSTFNNLLTKTNLADSINRRKTITITVLALDNSAASAFYGLDNATLRNLLKVHVILDYYDSVKLGNLQGSVLLTTVLQASGVARESMGFVNMTKFPAQHRIALRSALQGAPFTSDIVGPVMSDPYNISVLRVSGPILTRDVYNLNSTILAPPPPKASADPPTPAGITPVSAPAANATVPAADAPTLATDAPSPGDASKSSAGRVRTVGGGLGVAVFALLMGL